MSNDFVNFLNSKVGNSAWQTTRNGLCPPITVHPLDCTKMTVIPQNECEALVALYNSTDGDNWNNKTNWLTSTTPASWNGSQQ